MENMKVAVLKIVVFCMLVASPAAAQSSPSSNQPGGGTQKLTNAKDVELASASDKLFDLFTRYPNYNYYRPQSYYPGAYNPGYYPGSSGYPGSGGYPGFGGYPSTGTNFLGGGGYGGFGGNGGLPTYSGYNSNYYLGARNLGFGYQQGTNSLGLGSPTFTPSSSVTSAQVAQFPSGFRGYN